MRESSQYTRYMPQKRAANLKLHFLKLKAAGRQEGDAGGGRCSVNTITPRD